MNCVISIVCPLYNESDVLPEFLDQLSEVLRREYTYYEIILVDDGSTDGTQSLVEVLVSKCERVRCLFLSRHSGREVAITAGLETAVGDYVVVMVPSTDPPELVPKFVDVCRQGSPLVMGVGDSPRRGGLLFRLGSSFFHWYCGYLGLEFLKNSTDFRCLNRQAVNAVTRFGDKHRYLRMFTARTGFRQAKVVYHLRAPHRFSGGLAKECHDAMEIIVANSKHPLRCVSWLGLLLSGINLCYIGYIVLIYFFKSKVAEGWTTSSLQSAGMFFFLFLTLAVLCEYVGRVLEETQNRPLYFVGAEASSNVSLEATMTKNIVTQTEEGPRHESVS